MGRLVFKAAAIAGAMLFGAHAAGAMPALGKWQAREFPAHYAAGTPGICGQDGPIKGRRDALTEKGRKRVLRGKAKGAVAPLEKAVKEWPDDPVAYYWLGRAYGKLPAEEWGWNAVECLQVASQILPKDIAITGDLAEAYMRVEHPGAVMKELEGRLALSQEDAAARYAIARAYLCMWQQDAGTGGLPKDVALGYARVNIAEARRLAGSEPAILFYSAFIECNTKGEGNMADALSWAQSALAFAQADAHYACLDVDGKDVERLIGRIEARMRAEARQAAREKEAQ
ncbi:MAG: hypothetical protein WC717_02105 [Candidatus Micrarchaeia archaeon]|jgi:hypothetical protein